MANEFVGMMVSTPLVSRAKRYLRGLTDPIRYRLKVRFQPRQNHIYTQFHRFPRQYEVLVDHVLPALLAERRAPKDQPIEIAVFGCCSGEEVYTLAYVLATRAPALPIRIRGYDIVPELIAQATRASYAREHVSAGPFVTDAFVKGLFDTDGDTCTVKPELASVASFAIGDVTDATFMDGLPRSEFVFAQNLLFHLPRPLARRAFQNLVNVLRSGGTLFVNGMDTDMRATLTRQYGLEPVEQRIAEIHEDARVDRGAHWANSYWGREPLKMSRDWVRKYCTIYRKKS
jgi:chemotaxis methyl-accepting protein methylase